MRRKNAARLHEVPTEEVPQLQTECERIMTEDIALLDAGYQWLLSIDEPLAAEMVQAKTYTPRRARNGEKRGY